MNRYSRADSYEKITNQILDVLDRGTLPWRKPFSSMLPRSERGHQYRGLNMLVLLLNSYSDPRWLTFNRVRELGGTVRKGQKATWISYWRQIEVESDTDVKTKTIPILKPYAVFNAEQCDGLNLPVIQRDLCDGTPIERAEEVLRNLPWNLTIREGQSAFWSPADPDAITLPARKSFRRNEDFYSVAYHEILHATSTPDRMSRDISGHFGDPKYGFEELIAQFGASFLCAAVGIDNTVEQDAAYISGWAAVLRNDPRMIISAAGQAQRAADYILGAAHTSASGDVAA